MKLDIAGESVSFTGVGYHDKNWGDQPFTEAIESWYWGHAHLGPYGVVWFDAIGSDGKEYVSGYVTRSGIPLLSSCQSDALNVRPFGSAYPPTPSTPQPDGYLMEFDLGPEGKLQVNSTLDLVVVDTPIYFRYTGKVTGGIVGEEQFEGKALGEQFAF